MKSILKEHYKKIGSKGGSATVKNNGVEFMKKISQLATKARKKKAICK